VLFTKYSKDSQITVDEAGGACSMHERVGKYFKNSGWKMSGRDDVRDLGIDGRIIL
jgi:hypothetical protein